MKRLYTGILFITSLVCVSPNRIKRFSVNGQRGASEWSWSRNEELADAQTKTSSKANWPNNGNGGSTKGRGDSNPNRDGSWAPDSWSSEENRNDGYDMGWNKEPQGNNKGSAYPDGDGDQKGDLGTILRGVPGMDFPNFVTVPETDFDCSRMPSQGYYGDVEAGCQVFHICQPGNRKDSFLCPVGTIFNQKYFVCDWWFNVNCSETPSYFDLNNEVYKDPVAVTEEVPVTTEKTLPWNSQDLDKKRPTKSWGSQPTTGKQNPRWKDTPTRRGSKTSDSASTSREVSNAWSRSDVQKEVTLSWGASSGTFGSSSTFSNSFVPTTKPIWYGIDGQPAKDQSNGMSKRVGMAQTPAPFGTRMRSNAATSTTNSWASEVDEPTTSTLGSKNYGNTSRIWMKGGDIYNPSSTTRGWLNDDVTDDSRINGGSTWNNDVNYDYSTTKGWLKDEDIPETSINPTGIKGVWEQQTAKRSDESYHTDVNTARRKIYANKSDYSVQSDRNFQTASNQETEWGQRRRFRNTQSSTVANRENRGWIKNNYENRKAFDNRNINTIPHSKNWK